MGLQQRWESARSRRFGTPESIACPFLGFAVALLPWTVHLWLSLPASPTDRLAGLFWVGFDVALSLALSGAAWLTWQRRREATVAAASAATLLVADAAIDLTSAAPGWPFTFALVRAIFLELPIAGFTFYASRRIVGFTLKENNMESNTSRNDELTIEPTRPDATGHASPAKALRSADDTQRAGNDGASYTAEEQALVEARLKNLGYL